MSTDPMLKAYMRGGPSGGVFRSQNLGLYTYAWNNPVRLKDPNGLVCAETGASGQCGGGHDPQVEVRAAEEAARQQAAAAQAAAQQARYQAWFKSLPPDHQAMVRRANAGGAAAATDAAINRTTQNAQVGGQAMIAMGKIGAWTAVSAALWMAGVTVGGGGAAAGGGEAEGGGATLYRAVGEQELADIQAVGAYRVPPGGTEGKYFFQTPEQASNFARMMGDQPYTTTSVQVSPAQLAGGQPINPAGEGPGFFFSTPNVPPGPVTIYNYSAVP